MTDIKKKETGAKKLTLNKETLKDLNSKTDAQGGARPRGGPATTCRGSALACPSEHGCA